MKKILLSLLIVLTAVLILNFYPVVAQAKIHSSIKAKTKTVKHRSKTAKYKTTLKWDTSGLKYLNNSAAFDYSSAVRNAVIKKIENYARRKHIKVITGAVINSMRE